MEEYYLSTIIAVLLASIILREQQINTEPVLRILMTCMRFSIDDLYRSYLRFSSIEDLSSDDISEALVVSHENHTVSDDLDADDYDFDNMFM